MDREKRTGEKPPVPDDLNKLLQPEQLSALRQIEGFGWQLKFVRRPLFQDPVAIVYSADGTKIGVLEEDGRLNMEPDIKVRS
ncbi:MAG: hypothetical protein RQ736_00530 [Thiogranum sp.]|nr:hypothetical protein [Thiogranum sp.]